MLSIIIYAAAYASYGNSPRPGQANDDYLMAWHQLSCMNKVFDSVKSKCQSAQVQLTSKHESLIKLSRILRLPIVNRLKLGDDLGFHDLKKLKHWRYEYYLRPEAYQLRRIQFEEDITLQHG